jgi:hypothetical protein
MAMAEPALGVALLKKVPLTWRIRKYNIFSNGKYHSEAI